VFAGGKTSVGPVEVGPNEENGGGIDGLTMRCDSPASGTCLGIIEGPEQKKTDDTAGGGMPAKTDDTPMTPPGEMTL